MPIYPDIHYNNAQKSKIKANPYSDDLFIHFVIALSFLQLVLAFGNYMNKGQRGGAFGFRISSLNKLADVRATTDRSLTLLHYIIKVCTQQWPDLLNLPKDLTSVHEGAKVK